MIKRGPGLPPSVILRTGQHIEAHELCEALRCSRAVLWHWRKAFGFPKCSVKKGRSALTDRQAVASWLYSHGVKIVYI